MNRQARIEAIKNEAESALEHSKAWGTQDYQAYLQDALTSIVELCSTPTNDLKTEHLLNAPSSSHYKQCAIEPLQYIEANNLGFSEGCVVKYVSRWREKGGIDDLKKARFYIDRLIERETRGEEE